MPNTHVSYSWNFIFIDDGSIWNRMRNPVFWLIFLVQLVPFFGVGVFFFFIDFLMIDKSDEY